MLLACQIRVRQHLYHELRRKETPCSFPPLYALASPRLHLAWSPVVVP